ncbi:hypothetical protein [Pallidibacillus pasinlerensis]|nr:hypothetical protein [Pallidibacillus pasinlerensis]
MGFVLLSKPITMIEIIGSVFIVGGVVFSTYQKKRAIEATIEHAKAG